MAYAVKMKASASKFLSKMERRDGERVRDAIDMLAETPRPPNCKKLTDQPGWRYKVPPFRVIYDIDDAAKVLTVRVIDHRRDAYR